MPEKPPVIYEEAAEHRTDISGWVCKTCRRFYGDDQHSLAEHHARWCCATDSPCPECSGRVRRKGLAYCDACCEKRDVERWAALERVEWDGETPLCDWRSDRYYFDDGDVADRLNEFLADGGKLEDFRVVLCEREMPRSFEMSEFLYDYTGSDHAVGEAESAEIDKIVNAWIESHAPKMWISTGKAIDPESLRWLIEPPAGDAT